MKEAKFKLTAKDVNLERAIQIRTDGGSDIKCPGCGHQLTKFHIVSGGVPIVSGYGICGCPVPQKYLA